MRIVHISGPVSEPVLLEEVKTHLRIENDLEDASISSFIIAARCAVEAVTDLCLVDRNIDVYADNWADLIAKRSVDEWLGDGLDSLVPGPGKRSAILLPVRPVSAVNAINLVDDDGTETEWPSSNYKLQPGIESVLRLTSGASWPILSGSIDAIRISVTAGFGPDWNAVPDLIQQAILKTATKLYFDRGDGDLSSANLLAASGAERLLNSFRRVRL